MTTTTDTTSTGPTFDEVTEITVTEGHAAGETATMFSDREVPWSKLGKLHDAVTTAAEAAKLGGLDFTVTEEPIFRGTPGKMKKIAERKALTRDDTGAWLSIVSKDYPVVQFAQAFDVMDGQRFVAAGALRGGRQGFMVIDTGLSVSPLGDEHKLFGILRTSHDCSRAVEISAMPLRGKCMNSLTLNTFTKDAKYRWSIVHAGNVTAKLVAAKETMSRLGQYLSVFEANVERLGAIKVTDERAVDVLKFALPNRPKRDETIQTIISGWHGRPTVGYEGTGWGLINAVSEYMEWDRKNGNLESRFLGALQGPIHNAINKTATYLLTRA